jgi:transposase
MTIRLVCLLLAVIVPVAGPAGQGRAQKPPAVPGTFSPSAPVARPVVERGAFVIPLASTTTWVEFSALVK